LNNSGWPITNIITPANKLQFLQHLIHDEVMVKRERNLKAICRGLEYVNVGKLIKMHPDVTRSLFVAANSNITAKAFLSLTSIDEPKNEDHGRALDYFKEFIAQIESKKLAIYLGSYS